MVRIGIVGIGFGQAVLVPAFRAHPRCEVVSLAASRPERAEAAARRLGLARWHGDWRALVEDRELDAVAIAVPPAVQPAIVRAALAHGKAIFCEKPVAVDAEEAAALAREAAQAGRAHLVDFEFPEIEEWQAAKRMLDEGRVGRLLRLAMRWHRETRVNRLRARGWKAEAAMGGGALCSFGSHALHSVEWFAGPIRRVAASCARTLGDDRDADTHAEIQAELASGARAEVSLCTDDATGSGHRLEFDGDAGSFVLENVGSDPARRFRIRARTEAEAAAAAPEEPDAAPDGRIAPVRRLVDRFVAWIETGVPARPDLGDGARVQRLLDAARRSHETRAWVDVP